MIFVHWYVMRLMIDALVFLVFGPAFVFGLILMAKKAYENRDRRAPISGIGEVQTVMVTLSTVEMSPKQAAKLLGISNKAIEHMLRAGEIGYFMSGNRKVLLAKDVLGWRIRNRNKYRNPLVATGEESGAGV